MIFGPQSQMKYLPFAWLCLLCVPPTNVGADGVNGIDILSSVYSIDAPWRYTWYSQTYHQIYSSDSGNYGGASSDGARVGGQLTSAGPFPPGLGCPVSGNTWIIGSSPGFGVSGVFCSYGNHTSAWVTDGIYTGSDGNQYSLSFYGTFVDMQAQASWTFRPNGDALQVALYISNYGIYVGSSGLSVTLEDITHPSVLLAFSESDIWRTGSSGQAINITNIFSVSTSDTYELTVYGRADTYNSDFSDQNLTASIRVVPEPSAFGLCLLGLLSLAGFKRWRLGHPRR
jgi:hypothetical protein